MIRATIPHKTFRFPVGELQVNLDLSNHDREYRISTDVEFRFERTEEVFELMLLVDALKREHYKLGTLYLPYVPFSRQDRVNHPGESFSLSVFANIINGLGFPEVVIDDPHSDVTAALIHNCRVKEQWEFMLTTIVQHTTESFYLVSPDAGALKKTYKLAKMLHDSSVKRCLGVIEAGKKRDTSTGEITGTVIHGGYLTGAASYYIIDDIIDGGRTFVELAKALRANGATHIELFATHGFFTKGKAVFDGLIDKVYAVHDYSEERK